MRFDPATSCIISQYSTITIFLKPILYHYNISQANTLPLQYFSSQYSTITIFLKPILYHYNISPANTLPLRYFSSQYSTITIFLKPILYHYNISQANTLPLQYFSSQYSTITIFLKPIFYHYNISQLEIFKNLPIKRRKICFFCDQKRQKYFQVVNDRRKEIDRNSHAEIYPLWWLKILQFNCLNTLRITQIKKFTTDSSFMPLKLKYIYIYNYL
jgi:hypothetical protein